MNKLIDKNKVLKELDKVGVTDASYIIENQNVVYESLASQFHNRVILKDIRMINDERLWSLVDYHDEIINDIKNVEEKNEVGGLYAVFEKDIILPFQSCMILSNDVVQKLHHLIIVKENVNATMITGCTTRTGEIGGEHRSITEIIVGDNATLNYTMIHDWGKNTKVYPRTFVKLGKNSKIIYNYVNLHPVSNVKSISKIITDEKSVVSSNSLVYVMNSDIDINTIIELGKKANGKIIMKGVFDEGRLISRGKIVGKYESIGHNECDVLMLKDGEVKSIPELVAYSKDAQMSHEAAIGKLSEKEIEYLMTRGMTKDEAISLIVHGFLDTKLLRLPEEIQKEVNKLFSKI